jgi:anaphase-promoting complex subunit 1
VSKTLCLHIPSLLPATHSSDMDIPSLTQVAAVAGLGLLYSGSGNRAMAEFLLSELCRRTVIEKGMDHHEVYALSAAWALGMLIVGRGAKRAAAAGAVPAAAASTSPEGTGEASDSLSDLRLEDRLLRCIEGGPGGSASAYYGSGSSGSGGSDLRGRPGTRGGVSSLYAADAQSRSSTVIEPEELVNTAVTAFGATIALGLMYIRTDNETVSSRLRIPTTVYMLESERPDLLCMRSAMTCLVNWGSTERACSSGDASAAEWLQAQIPPALLAWCLEGGAAADSVAEEKGSSSSWKPAGQMSHRSAAMAYLSIITGSCLGLALVHAGTAHAGVKAVVLSNLSMILKLRSGKWSKFQRQQGADGDRAHVFSAGFIKACGEKSSKILLEMYLACLAVSAGIVMSGTGHSSALMIPVYVHNSIHVISSPFLVDAAGDVDCLRLVREARLKSEESSYGTHMALAMATGAHLPSCFHISQADRLIAGIPFRFCVCLFVRICIRNDLHVRRQGGLQARPGLRRPHTHVRVPVVSQPSR